MIPTMVVSTSMVCVWTREHIGTIYTLAGILVATLHEQRSDIVARLARPSHHICSSSSINVGSLSIYDFAGKSFTPIVPIPYTFQEIRYPSSATHLPCSLIRHGTVPVVLQYYHTTIAPVFIVLVAVCALPHHNIKSDIRTIGFFLCLSFSIRHLSLFRPFKKSKRRIHLQDWKIGVFISCYDRC